MERDAHHTVARGVKSTSPILSKLLYMVFVDFKTKGKFLTIALAA